MNDPGNPRTEPTTKGVFAGLRNWYRDWTTRDHQALERVFAGRSVLSDEAFYDRFFARSPAGRDVVTGVRQAFITCLPLDMRRLEPDDSFNRELQFVWACDSMADVELICEIEKRFAISLPEYRLVDVTTMREMVELVHRTLEAKQHGR
jgi:acyl carrier protein